MITESMKDELRERDTDDLLDSLSLELMIDNIIQQINEELPPNRDYLSVVTGKFRYIISNEEFDDQTKSVIKGEIDDFCKKIINAIVGKFNLCYAEHWDSLEVSELLYHFFVLDRVSNTKKFIMTYIEENKDDIVDSLGLERGQDVMSVAASHKTDDLNGIKIASNANSVISYILGLSIEVGDFLDVLAAEGEYYANLLQDYVEKNTINGNFVTEYMSGVLDEYDSDYSAGIRNDIRIQFGFKNTIKED